MELYFLAEAKEAAAKRADEEKKKSNTTTEWFPHDNGGRPFRVVVDESRGRVDVHLLVPGRRVATYQDEPTHTFQNVQRVWVGQSPQTEMTEQTGNHGPEWDGNTLLLTVEGERQYIWIGNRGILSFATSHPLVSFVSPVGNNDVPYAYVVDSTGACYLLLENVVLTRGAVGDPYRYYYDHHRFTVSNSGIRRFFIGEKQYSLSYAPFPDKEYERCSHLNTPLFATEEKQDELSFVDVSLDERQVFSKEEFVRRLEEFGQRNHFAAFVTTTLYPH